MNAPHLAGRVAVISGSSRGIGLSVAHALAGHGAAVVLNGRDAAVLATAAEGIAGDTRWVAGSAADPAVAEELVATAVEELGGLDIVISCAGTAEPAGSSILSITSAEFAALIDAHLTSTFELCRAAVPTLVAQGSGSIVTTGSHAFTGVYGGTGYPAAKGGVNSLTLALAAELKEHGIRVNTVCPGASTRLSTGPAYEAHIEELHRRGLMDDATRFGSLHPAPAAYVAQLYAFLASDLAAGVTGQILAGSGGYLGRFPRPEAELLTWRDHAEHPPWTLAEIAGFLAPQD